MRDISAVVEKLQAVRLAQRNFLGLWALEQEIILPALDRVAADMNAIAPSRGLRNSGAVMNDPRSAADE
ncbi:MAG: hypothetical protein WB646_21395 [Steroidobacteraceae bacterium]